MLDTYVDIRTHKDSNIHFKYAMSMEELDRQKIVEAVNPEQYEPKNLVQLWLFQVRTMEILQSLYGIKVLVVPNVNNIKDHIKGEDNGSQNNCRKTW